MVVFDADMVAKPNFFTKILEVMEDDDVALCLTPQVGAGWYACVAVAAAVEVPHAPPQHWC